MVGAIARADSVYHSPNLYRISQRLQQSGAMDNAAAARLSGSGNAAGTRIAAARRAQPEVPVQPAEAVKPVRDSVFDKNALLHYMAADPVEAAVRSRIQYLNGDSEAKTEDLAGLPWQTEEKDPRLAMLSGRDDEKSIPGLPGQDTEEDPRLAMLPGQDDEKSIPGLPGQEKAGELLPNGADKTETSKSDDETPKVGESPSAQEVAEEGECQTCKNRKYQDGSDDPGVSFKTPTNVDPKMAQAAVRGHENEHVVRERAKAAQEDRKVISQSVSYHNAICPECGKVYLAGGTTRTVTVNQPEYFEPEQEEENERLPFFAFA